MRHQQTVKSARLACLWLCVGAVGLLRVRVTTSSIQIFTLWAENGRQTYISALVLVPITHQALHHHNSPGRHHQAATMKHSLMHRLTTRSSHMPTQGLAGLPARQLFCPIRSMQAFLHTLFRSARSLVRRSREDEAALTRKTLEAAPALVRIQVESHNTGPTLLGTAALQSITAALHSGALQNLQKLAFIRWTGNFKEFMEALKDSSPEAIIDVRVHRLRVSR